MMVMRSHVHAPFGARRAGSAACALALAALALSAGHAAASEIEVVRATVEAAPVPAEIVVDARMGFDSFPAHLLPAHAPPPAQRAPDAQRAVAVDDGLLADAWTISGALGLPPLSPLEMEQPMRVYDSDVLVKFRAPGGRSSFATVELIF